MSHDATCVNSPFSMFKLDTT